MSRGRGSRVKCTKCGEIKASKHFYKHKTSKGGVRPRCKSCCSEESRVTRLRNDFGLSVAEYDALWDACRGRCEICQRTSEELPRRLCVDHCHETGEVRGLLCNGCNLAIGKLGDDLEALKRAVAYLERFERKQ